LVEITITVAIIGLLTVIALPSATRARNSAQVRACISNLQHLDAAKALWALEYRQPDTAVPTSSDVRVYLRGERMPSCPASGSYRLRRVARVPTCTLLPKGHTLRNLDLDDDPAAD
jgi:type II secretory pathway pseudopilin PulG